MSEKTRGSDTVHNPVVPGEGDGQSQAWYEGIAIPHRLHVGPSNTKNGDFRGIDDRTEAGSANPAQAGYGESAATHVCRAQFAVPGFGSQFGTFPGNAEQSFPVRVA